MSKKKIQQKKKKEHKNQKLYIGICAVVFVAVVGALFYAWWTQIPPQDNSSNAKLWSINSSGKLDFAARGPIQVTSDVKVETGTDYTLENISFNSYGDNVYAFLRIPTNVTKPPVVVSAARGDRH